MFASNAASLASQSSTFEGIRQGSNVEKLGKVDFSLLRKTVVFYVCLATYPYNVFDTVFSVVHPFHPEARGQNSADNTED